MTHSLQRTWALLFASVIMLFPANLYPIMTTTLLGQSQPATILGGVVQLWHKGSWPITLIIFFASIVVPVGKIITLSWLCLMVRRSEELKANVRTRLYRITEFIGRWSMVDLFVVAIMVALIRAGNIMSIAPGPAAIAFGAVVVLTMLAAMSFDPRLIWDDQNPEQTNTFRKVRNE